MTSKEALNELSKYIERLGGAETQDWEDIILRDLDKLGQYEDIEKQLGIDFITLYKAITKGVWVKHDLGQIYHTFVGLHNLTISSGSLENDFCFITPNKEVLLFCNLNKGWALEKGELENE